MEFRDECAMPVLAAAIAISLTASIGTAGDRPPGSIMNSKERQSVRDPSWGCPTGQTKKAPRSAPSLMRDCLTTIVAAWRKGGRLLAWPSPKSRLLETAVDNLRCLATVERNIKEIHNTTHQIGGVGGTGISRGRDLTGKNNAPFCGLGTRAIGVVVSHSIDGGDRRDPTGGGAS